MNYAKSLIPIAIFSILSLVIIFPLLAPGFILTLDAVVTSHINFVGLTSSSFLYQNSLALLNYLIPAFIVQKILLFFIFFLSGWGMFRLVGKQLGIFGYFAGFFYTLNPFVYERIMAGHWQFLLGYSIFPFVIASTMKFLQKLDIRNLIILSVWVTLLFNIAIHYIFIYIPFFIITAILYMFFNTGNLNEYVKKIPICFALIFLFNSNWIVSSVMGISDVATSVASFTNDDLLAFQSVADKHFGLIFNLLSGYGYWADVYGYFISPKSIVFFWPVLTIALLIFVAFGIKELIQTKDSHVFILTVSLLLLSLFALDLAGGVALASFSQPLMTLYDKLPILRSLREPQKLIAMLMFSYAFFASYGLNSLYIRLKSHYQKGLIFLSLAFPIIYTPTMFGSFWGQLHPVSYPQQWQNVNQLMSKDKDNFLTLFFPWHQYMRFQFTNNMVVSNPAVYFFDKPILSAQNYETENLETHDMRTEALHVEGLLSIEKDRVNLLGDPVNESISWGEALGVVNVKYIILAKEEDYKLYWFLDQSEDLVKLFEDDNIILYKNNRWSSDSATATEPFVEYTKEELEGL